MSELERLLLVICISAYTGIFIGNVVIMVKSFVCRHRANKHKKIQTENKIRTGGREYLSPVLL
uniref:hypothetical protein n=1 Tax=uncultured Ruminococcus sp. TaxID=165186 RepID=UPI0025DBE95C|nr:hypothetical protein [uncultured Ruminococcus sp.]